MSFKQNYKVKVANKIESYCETNYELLSKDDMIMGKGLFNHRCHLNAVQQVKLGKCDEVYMCMVTNSSNYPVVHFINKKGNKFVDNTLGYLYESNNYFIIKKVEESEYHRIADLLMNTKKTLLDLHSSKFLNKILSIDEEDFGI